MDRYGFDLVTRRKTRSSRSQVWAAQDLQQGIDAPEPTAITLPIRAGSATATLAAKLAMLHGTSSAHSSMPPRQPDRDSASSVVHAATIIPSRRQRREGSDPPQAPFRSSGGSAR
jgi:hypothetical protein